MRRIIIHTVSLLILLASTGLKLEAHYCHGHFAGIKFVYNSCCCDEKKADCCEDKVIQVEKADFEYNPEQLQESSPQVNAHICLAQWPFLIKAIEARNAPKMKVRGDPPERPTALYIFYNRLLHYG